ncbi:unnamed protein product [Mycena citricolor]|uniref:mRNA-capping enzyme subunit alpha n=1 Tax=Mycena citricolor TaxID=2018698 RepID=A0AAD2GYA0_9AGAR|nr:unnamed protein product [Mycena citricolor]CAK5277357.1 unnamed protein product [Mycena citricolor]
MPASAAPMIPSIPGERIPHSSDQLAWLRDSVGRICGVDSKRFPGSQPVSFAQADLAKLENQDFFVCEKSDGVRVLLVVLTDPSGSQFVHLVDRKNDYYDVRGIYFPHHENPTKPLQNTIVDGELVYDVDPTTRAQTLRFLAFDCLVVNDQNIMSRPLDKRYGRLKEWFYKPFARMKVDHPQVAQSHLFDIRVKDVKSSYNAEQVFMEMPHLQHGSDGLIYTCVNARYSPGTDPNILKWKPPSENSIDFKLVLRFPPLSNDPTQPDFHAKPVFVLNMWCGDERYEQYDVMYVEDSEWESMKASGDQYDDRIVEVHWDPSKNHWRFMRFRDDKLHGNHRSVVESIVSSIADGVERETLLSRSTAIRNAWKVRMGNPQPAVMSAPQSVVEFKFGPLGTSQWSKVSGPLVIAGMKR